MSWRWWQKNVEKPVTGFFKDAGDDISREWKNAGKGISKWWKGLSPEWRAAIIIIAFIAIGVLTGGAIGVLIANGSYMLTATWTIGTTTAFSTTGAIIGGAVGAGAGGYGSFQMENQYEEANNQNGNEFEGNEGREGKQNPQQGSSKLPRQEPSEGNNPVEKTTAPEDSKIDIVDPHDSETDRDITDDDIDTTDVDQDPVIPDHTTEPIGSPPPSTAVPPTALPTDATEQYGFEQSDKETPSFEQPYDESIRYFGDQGDTESAVGAKKPTLEKSYSERSEKTSGGSYFYSTKSNNDYKTYFELENPEEKILIYQSSSFPRQSPEKTPLKEEIIDTAAKTADRIDAVLETAHKIKPAIHVPILNKHGIKTGSRTYLTKALDSSGVAKIAKNFSLAGDALSIGYNSYGYYSTNEKFGSSHPKAEEAGRKAFGVSTSVGIGFIAGAVSGPFAPLVGLAAKELSGLYFEEVENQRQQAPYYQDYTRQYDRYLDYQAVVKAYWKDRAVEKFSSGLENESIIDRMGIPVNGEKISDPSRPAFTQGYGVPRPLYIPKQARRKFGETHPLDPDNSLIPRRSKQK